MIIGLGRARLTDRCDFSGFLRRSARNDRQTHQTKGRRLSHKMQHGKLILFETLHQALVSILLIGNIALAIRMWGIVNSLTFVAA